MNKGFSYESLPDTDCACMLTAVITTSSKPPAHVHHPHLHSHKMCASNQNPVVHRVTLTRGPIRTDFYFLLQSRRHICCTWRYDLKCARQHVSPRGQRPSSQKPLSQRLMPRHSSRLQQFLVTFAFGEVQLHTYA